MTQAGRIIVVYPWPGSFLRNWEVLVSTFEGIKSFQLSAYWDLTLDAPRPGETLQVLDGSTVQISGRIFHRVRSPDRSLCFFEPSYVWAPYIPLKI